MHIQCGVCKCGVCMCVCDVQYPFDPCHQPLFLTLCLQFLLAIYYMCIVLMQILYYWGVLGLHSTENIGVLN